MVYHFIWAIKKTFIEPAQNLLVSGTTESTSEAVRSNASMRSTYLSHYRGGNPHRCVDLSEGVPPCDLKFCCVRMAVQLKKPRIIIAGGRTALFLWRSLFLARIAKEEHSLPLPLSQEMGVRTGPLPILAWWRTQAIQRRCDLDGPRRINVTMASFWSLISVIVTLARLAQSHWLMPLSKLWCTNWRATTEEEEEEAETIKKSENPKSQSTKV